MFYKYRPEDKTCDITLIDYGQDMVCDIDELYEITEQVNLIKTFFFFFLI